MRNIILLLGMLAVLAGMLVFGLPSLHVEQRAPPATVTSLGPTIAGLERLSRLVTSRVTVVDILIGEGEGCRGVFLIQGDSLLAIDLDRAKILEKDEQTKQALILLPPPEVFQSRVNHEKTRTWEVHRLVWLPWNADADKLRDVVWLQAQRLVSQAAGSKENIDHAKRSAEAVIQGFYKECGWDVNVTWEDTPNVQVSTSAP